MAMAMTLPVAAQPTVLSGTLAKIADTGVIAIGYRQGEPPFSFEDADGSVIGFSIDLCRRIVDRIRTELDREDIIVTYVVATPATRFILVKTGAIDLECAATTNNAERREMVEFSFPHFLTATHVMTRRADNIESLQDLAGHTVAAASGTVNIEQLNALNREQNLNIAVLPTKSTAEAFDMVVAGRVSAFVTDGILLAAKIAEMPDPTLYALSTYTLSRPEPYGLLLRRDDAAFKSLVNDSLRAFYGSGDINALYAKWFTAPIPPSGINLNLPMSDDMAEAFREPVEYLQ
ncbi:amino acid ABC transporter substrate-binding protein [Devosia beringensis]|uniref:amino acid ABC transporter substrate-binding protein n=1 Tax=Devosia beringensis TaxID=2657486 RepID=UPI001E64A914|nr:amino acid ABC transporter substrate-binding protein [Devosia beringensis]